MFFLFHVVVNVFVCDWMCAFVFAWGCICVGLCVWDDLWLFVIMCRFLILCVSLWVFSCIFYFVMSFFWKKWFLFVWFCDWVCNWECVKSSFRVIFVSIYLSVCLWVCVCVCFYSLCFNEPYFSFLFMCICVLVLCIFERMKKEGGEDEKNLCDCNCLWLCKIINFEWIYISACMFIAEYCVC